MRFSSIIILSNDSEAVIILCCVKQILNPSHTDCISSVILTDRYFQYWLEKAHDCTRVTIARSKNIDMEEFQEHGNLSV